MLKIILPLVFCVSMAHAEPVVTNKRNTKSHQSPNVTKHHAKKKTKRVTKSNKQYHRKTASYSKVSTNLPSSFIMLDASTHQPVLDHEANVSRPMASLTKLMTAMVALDYDNNLSRMVGKRTREQMFGELLVRSNNQIAEEFSRDYPGGRPAFLAAMNAKAQKLGMHNTHFDDPSGLLASNTSNATDVAKMVSAAHDYEVIRRISTYIDLVNVNVKGKRVSVTKKPNTNHMILSHYKDAVHVSKTGFTSRAGFCVGIFLQEQNKNYVVVVMGARNSKERFERVSNLVNTAVKRSI
jgi:D-alanyl-D-alanine endopeptidase (penicillin-binding protein 7)